MAQTTTTSKTRNKNHGSSDVEDADVIDVLKTRAEDAVDELKTRAEDARDEVQAKASDVLAKVRDQISENPIQSVAIGICAGYLARMMFKGPLATLIAIGAGGYLGTRLAR